MICCTHNLLIMFRAHVHHQKLETILVLLSHMVCNAFVAGGRRSGAGQQAMRPGWGQLLEQLPCCPAPDRQPPATKALHTICGNNDDGNMSAINHSVASSWVSSLRIDWGKLWKKTRSQDILLQVWYSYIAPGPSTTSWGQYMNEWRKLENC